MKHFVSKTMLLCLLIICVIFSAFPAFAIDTGFEVVLTDVTDEDVGVLSGEAKIKVSIKGLNSNVSDAQVAFNFSGDLKYKSIEYLQGSDDYASGDFRIATDADIANNRKALSAGLVVSTPITFGEMTDLLIITFEGSAGKSVNLTLDKEHTFCKTIDGVVYASVDSSISAEATAEAGEGKKAEVKLTMDKVRSFSASSSSAASVLTLTITNERTGATIKTNISDSYRGSGTTPVFTVSNLVPKNDTYSVELSATGYVPYKASGISFDTALELTNNEFVPGDVNKDEKVDEADRTAINEIIADGEYSESADFNRDGNIDSMDVEVLSDVLGKSEAEPSPDTTVLPIISKPTITTETKKLTVKWTKPENTSNVKGYVVKYGTKASSLNLTKEITGADTTAVTITGLESGTKYYVTVAATGESEIGTFSEVASASTQREESGNSGTGGSGGGGGGSIGGGSVGGGSATVPSVIPNAPQSQVGDFTDLAGYEWASESIYALKNKGIISGTSATTYSPSNNIKRGDFILILVRMLGIDGEATNNFADVPVGSYYYDAIAKAKAAGIATGDGVNFNPEATITRQDLITLAYRAFLSKGYITETTDYASLNAFADKASISEYALGAVVSMVNSGIIKGADGNVNPLGNATRAEVAVMCKRLADLM